MSEPAQVSPPRDIHASPGPLATGLPAAVRQLLEEPRYAGRVLHEHLSPARTGRTVPWPMWVDPHLRQALLRGGVEQPWEHQVRAAEAAHEGRHVVVATGTASGKSLAYLLPALTAVAAGAVAPTGRGATALYLSPTKALAADQLASVDALEVPGVRAATYDGDLAATERRWVREHAQYVLTNPDMLHRSLLPDHARWAPFWRALRYVVIDESHRYRGMFGSHVALVVRRLRRIAARYGADPTFVLASATAAAPGESAVRLTGVDAVEVVDEDACGRGATRFWLWEPPLSEARGSGDGHARRPAAAEATDLMVDLVAARVRTLAFVRSRRGAESVARAAREALATVDPQMSGRVAAYRSGFLPEERRALESRLRSGELLGLASTNALELGVDVSGLDAVLVAGWPGTRSSLWQQAGRAGRAGGDALAILIADDDPLDTYLVHHPEAIFGADVEAVVLDPDNPHVLGPHLCAAAAELPLTEADEALFGPSTRAVRSHLEAGGLLRKRSAGWFWTSRERAVDLTDLRGGGGAPVTLVESGTGRVLGSVDAGAAQSTAHAGAVYLHQGACHVVELLDLEAGVALVRREDVDWTTSARHRTDVRLLAVERRRRWGSVQVVSGTVEVTSQVISFLRRSTRTGSVIGEESLDLPARTLRTRAVWWTVPHTVLEAHGVDVASLAGSVHAVEHAAIGLLPLVSACDRWDVGGNWTARHRDTGEATVLVHDAAPGGSGFAERGFAAAATWLSAAAAVIADCGCSGGCPSCVQSPQCGSGNEPLDKAGALRLLGAVLEHARTDDLDVVEQGDEQTLVVADREAAGDAVVGDDVDVGVGEAEVEVIDLREVEGQFTGHPPQARPAPDPGQPRPRTQLPPE